MLINKRRAIDTNFGYHLSEHFIELCNVQLREPLHKTAFIHRLA